MIWFVQPAYFHYFLLRLPHIHVMRSIQHFETFENTSHLSPQLDAPRDLASEDATERITKWSPIIWGIFSCFPPLIYF